MLVHRKKQARYSIQTPLTSLIDIVFLLLIYFILTMNFIADEGITIKIPQAVTGKVQPPEGITVVVDKDGAIFFDQRRVGLDELPGLLSVKIAGRKDVLVTVKADRQSALSGAVGVMDAARLAGAGRLSLATEKEE